jgi:hypothetical protein
MNERCGLPETMVLNTSCVAPISRWKVLLPSTWNGWSFDELVVIWKKALALWSDVVDVRFESDGSADLKPSWGQIDGPGNVLAWSQLPCPWQPPVTQLYDESENWVPDMGIKSGISLPLVIAHEVGHALGIGHGPTGNLMAPYIDSTMTNLGEWDLAEIKARYGQTQPPPNGDDGMQGFLKCLVTVLPALLTCLFSAETTARAAGKDGPLEELQKYADSLGK